MKINYFDCEHRFTPAAGYGCNCAENLGGKCVPDNKIPGQEDECEFVSDFNTITFGDQFGYYYHKLIENNRSYKFHVVCDDTNNTEITREKGETIIDVYGKPPIEFVILNLVRVGQNEVITNNSENIVPNNYLSQALKRCEHEQENSVKYSSTTKIWLSSENEKEGD
jgi:hypothetical protein